jgi:hypothetical protein
MRSTWLAVVRPARAAAAVLRSRAGDVRRAVQAALPGRHRARKGGGEVMISPDGRHGTAATGAVRLALAAVLVAGAAAAAAASAGPASAAPARPAGLTWHSLTLINGWKSANNVYDTGDPAWAILDGIVYLSGSLTQPGATPESKATVAILPPPARPFRATYFISYVLNGIQGGVGINNITGQLGASSNDPADAQQYTSLAGISYPAASTASTNLPLINGWDGEGTTGGVEYPAMTLAGGTVHLTGQAVNGTTLEISALPAAARPARYAYFPVQLGAGVIGAVSIAPDGLMELTSLGGQGFSNAQDFTALDTINFLTASTAVTPLSLLDGWQSAQGLYDTGDPGYSVAVGIVHLSGSLTQPAAGSDEFAILPPSARPSHYLYITTYALNGTAGTVEITPAGYMYAWGPDLSDTQEYTSLAGITFPAGS